MEPKRKQAVMVAPISGGGMVHASQMLLAYWLPIWSSNPDVPYEFVLSPELGSSPQEYARNLVCGRFLKSECDVLLMIDDDMIVSGTVLDLLQTPGYDIAGPLQYMFMPADPSKGRHFPRCHPCAFVFDREAPVGRQIRPTYPVSGTGASYVEAVGSGTVAIKRRVIEDPRMLLAPDLDPPALFKNVYMENGERLRGLDVDFCYRANTLGYKIMVNWPVQVGHFKRTNLNDVDAYAKGSFALGFEKGTKEGKHVA